MLKMMVHELRRLLCIPAFQGANNFHVFAVRTWNRAWRLIQRDDERRPRYKFIEKVIQHTIASQLGKLPVKVARQIESQRFVTSIKSRFFRGDKLAQLVNARLI